jgi:ribosomal protein S18 acetylase RimI-like enzyme
MSNIEYIARDESGLGAIGPLWLKLQEHHRACGGEFARTLGAVTWEQRQAGLLKKVAGGRLLVDLARDGETGQYVGYCVTSLTADLRGEIESIYVEPEYRRKGIGDCLMWRALRLFDEGGAKVRTLGVAAGNEEVFRFYRRYGFVPRATILQQIEEVAN